MCHNAHEYFIYAIYHIGENVILYNITSHNFSLYASCFSLCLLCPPHLPPYSFLPLSLIFSFICLSLFLHCMMKLFYFVAIPFSHIYHIYKNYRNETTNQSVACVNLKVYKRCNNQLEHATCPPQSFQWYDNVAHATGQIFPNSWYSNECLPHVPSKLYGLYHIACFSLCNTMYITWK